MGAIRWLGRYLYEVLAAVSILLNALRAGRRRESLCSACGRNMLDGGWASRVRWPRWFVDHCVDERERSEPVAD